MNYIKHNGIYSGIILLLSFPGIALCDTKIEYDIEAGLGFDSNPYHTPDKSYIDYAQKGDPLINPDKKTGFYMPLSAEVQLVDLNYADSFDKKYKLKMAKYMGKGLENADEYTHTLLFGKSVYDDNTYLEIELGIHRKTYFDRDDGLLKTTSGGSDISDRYNYINYGISIDHDLYISKNKLTIFTGVEKRNYDDPVSTTQLDQTRLTLGAKSQKRVSKEQQLKYGYKYTRRDYSYRHARDSSAALTTDLLEYGFHGFSITLVSDVTSSLKTYVDYDYKIRNDNINGYNDTRTNKVKVRGIYYAGDIKTRLALAYYNINYLNAFNYEDPLQGSKSTKSYTADLGVDFTYMGQNMWASIMLKNKDSSDLRYKYERAQASIGISLAI